MQCSNHLLQIQIHLGSYSHLTLVSDWLTALAVDWLRARQIKNLFSDTSQSEAMINVDPRVSVDFTCKYTADYTTEQASVATSPDNVTKHLMSQGMFAYSLKAGFIIFYSDSFINFMVASSFLPRYYG